MANFGAGDVPAMLAELGVGVTLGAQSTKGIVDRADDRLLEAEGGMAAVIGRDVVVTIQAGTLTGLTVGSAVTVDGTAYRVSSLLAIEDGELVRFACRKP